MVPGYPEKRERLLIYVYNSEEGVGICSRQRSSGLSCYRDNTTQPTSLLSVCSSITREGLWGGKHVSSKICQTSNSVSISKGDGQIKDGSSHTMTRANNIMLLFNANLVIITPEVLTNLQFVFSSFPAHSHNQRCLTGADLESLDGGITPLPLATAAPSLPPKDASMRFGISYLFIYLFYFVVCLIFVVCLFVCLCDNIFYIFIAFIS